MGGEGGGDDIVDEVFESVEMVISGEGGEGDAGEGAEVPVNVGGGEGAEVPDNVGGGEGGEMMENIGGDGGAIITEEQIGEKEKETDAIGRGSNDGGNNVGESNLGGAEIGYGGAEDMDGAGVVGGEGDVEGGDGGGDGNMVDGNEDNSGINVEPIPLIPRWRLREILAHAEGECMMLLC